jgi:hypothetical protein
MVLVCRTRWLVDLPVPARSDGDRHHHYRHSGHDRHFLLFRRFARRPRRNAGNRVRTIEMLLNDDRMAVRNALALGADRVVGSRTP